MEERKTGNYIREEKSLKQNQPKGKFDFILDRAKSRTPQETFARLVEIGIYYADGTLTEHYRPMNYIFGDPITAEEIQDEPWYPDFQAVCQIVSEETGDPFAACQDYFREFPRPSPTPDDRIKRWIKHFEENRRQNRESRA